MTDTVAKKTPERRQGPPPPVVRPVQGGKARPR